MTLPDLVLAALALAVSLVLAWRARPLAKVVLFVSALLIAGMLFLPGSQLTAIVGKDAVAWLTRVAARTPWNVSDWMHFGIFVWLGSLIWLARPGLRGWKSWLLVIVLSAAAELAQGLAPDRESRLDDVFLNLAGGMAGILLAQVGLLLARRLRRQARGR
ncbi:MAG: VanZ family protein [Gammaproteobacteria bacterium]|nr:VanZ family protein [Gammaproteobacteria bacterium]